MPWVTCRYPTPALAQDAGMTLAQFEDFLFGAVLLDWDEEGRKMERITERFDGAEEVRIVGEDTDLRFSLEGREGEVDAGHMNMPGGEVFYCPVEDSTEGVVTLLRVPGRTRAGRTSTACGMRYENGRAVEVSASSNEELLMRALDLDEGARVLGEFGIGCNPGIQDHMRNTLFDEKIYGTIHLAIGAGFPMRAEKTRAPSTGTWSRTCGAAAIELDGELVQEDGEWTF